MSEIDYVITKDGIFSRADVKEYVRPISSKEELTDLIERIFNNSKYFEVVIV